MSRFFAVVLLLVGCIASVGIAMIALADDPDLEQLGSMYACQNPQSQSDKTCITQDNPWGDGQCLIHGAGECSSALGSGTYDPAECPQCVAGECNFGMIIDEKPYGQCGVGEGGGGYSNGCEQCEYLTCAEARIHRTIGECEDNVFACAAWGWQNGACEPDGT